MMWDPVHQILAISSGAKQLSVKLSAVNLLGSHWINSVYLCEQHGVLKRTLNSTCLGSLYIQDFQWAMTLCEMDIVPQAEMVLQLQDNWYLVYSPCPFTSYVSCLNVSSSQVFIKHVGNCIFILPSCQLKLWEHVLISDFAIWLDAVIKHYEWDLDQIAFLDKEQARSAE